MSKVRARFTTAVQRFHRAVPDVAFFAGLAVASVGVGLIYLPAGLIVAGLALSGTVLASERKQK